MTLRATQSPIALAIVCATLVSCDAQPVPATPPAPPKDAAQAPPTPEPPAPIVAVPDAESPAQVPAPAEVPGPVADPAVAILGAWSGVRFEMTGGDAATGEQLARTMLLQFTPTKMRVALGLTGTVEGSWRAVRQGPDKLTVERAEPAPAQRFDITFHGRDEMTMTVSSHQAVRFARVTAPQSGQAPAAPPAPPATSPN